MKIVDNIKGMSESDDIWEQIDPKLLDDIYQGKSPDDNHFPDYSENNVKKRVRSTILLQSRPSVKHPLLMFKKHTMKVAVIVFLVGVSSLLLLKILPDIIALTEATEYSGSVSNTAVTKATLATGGTAVQPSGATQSLVEWPIKLVDNLDFDLSKVSSITINRYNEIWEIDKTVHITNRSDIVEFTSLLTQVTLEIATESQAEKYMDVRYLVAFFDDETDYTDIRSLYDKFHGPYATINFHKSSDQSCFFVEGSFMMSIKESPLYFMKFNAWDRIVQANDSLSYASFENLFEKLLG